jgi:hypothetical protein
MFNNYLLFYINFVNLDFILFIKSKLLRENRYDFVLSIKFIIYNYFSTCQLNNKHAHLAINYFKNFCKNKKN